MSGNTSLLLSLSGIAWFLAACSSEVGMSTTVDPLTVFPREATYRWDEAASSAPQDPRLAPLQLAALAREESERAFAERGYQAIDPGPADYRLAYQIHVNTVIEADASHSTVGLWLTLREDGSGRSVWSGALQAELHVGLTNEERRKRLRHELDQLLEDFPPDQRD